MHTVPVIQETNNLRAKPLYILCFIIVVITVYRGWILFHLPDLSLHFDEAQYWLWAQNLQWGYYSKPPMLAATIKLFTSFLGDSEPAVRMIGLLFYPLSALTLYFLTLKITGKSSTALWAGIIFITMPGISLSSLLITTDVVLFLWWGLSCYFFYSAIQTNKIRYWALLGIAAGLGLLTKYTMGIFAVAAGLFLILIPALRPQLKNPRLWFSALLSACLFSPNIWWNYQHDWPSVRHTAELSGEGVTGIHPLNVFTFWGEQLGVFGIVSFVIFSFWLILRIRHIRQLSQMQSFLLSFSAVFLLIISIQALTGRAYANWAAPTYFAASIVVAIQIAHSKALKLMLLISNLLLMGLIYHGDALQSWLKPHATKGPDPLKTLRAWDTWADEIKKALDQCPHCAVIVDRRESAAQFAYQLRDRRPSLLFWNPDNSQNNHYEMNYSLPAHPQKGTFLFLTEGALPGNAQNQFEHIDKLTTFDRQGKYKPIRHYALYQVEDFKGYQP